MSDPKATNGATPYRRTEVFISYRRSGNAGDAERLYDELKRYLPERRLFLDVKSIRTGDSFPVAIATALDSCDALFTVIGPQWLDAPDEQGRRRLDDSTDMVRREVSAALAKGKWIIPVLMHGASMPEKEELPDDMKPLADCQAVEIRSGRWQKDVRELVGLLKRRLYRKRRLAAALAFASALLVVAALSYHFATVALPVEFKPDGPFKIPAVKYHKKTQAGQEAGDEEGPLELVVEGVPAAAGELLDFNGKTVADVSVVFESARFEESSFRGLYKILKPEWSGDSGRLIYSTAHDPKEREEFEKENRDFENACSTSVTVAAKDADASRFSLRFFRENQPQPLKSREINLQADRELAVKSEVTAVNDPARGPYCSKQFRFNGVKSNYTVGLGAAFVTRPDAPFLLYFVPPDQEKTPVRDDLWRLGEDDSLAIRTPSLRASRVLVRARGVEEVPCDDRQGRPPTTIFEARSADGKNSLRLQRLRIGADSFSLDAEGQAYVFNKCVPESPADTYERVRRLNPLLASLLLASACVALVGLVYSVARL